MFFVEVVTEGGAGAGVEIGSWSEALADGAAEAEQRMVLRLQSRRHMEVMETRRIGDRESKLTAKKWHLMQWQRQWQWQWQ